MERGAGVVVKHPPHLLTGRRQPDLTALALNMVVFVMSVDFEGAC